MKTHEIRRALGAARMEAQAALEDYIQGARNAPSVTLSRSLIKARAYQALLIVPDSEHGLKLLRDLENDEPYTRKL